MAYSVYCTLLALLYTLPHIPSNSATQTVFCTVQGAIAKKPYNPILGETFKCYWDLPNGKRNAPDEYGKVC